MIAQHKQTKCERFSQHSLSKLQKEELGNNSSFPYGRDALREEYRRRTDRH